MKFKLHDIRESKVWKEAHEEGDAARLKKTIDTLVEQGMTFEKISALLKISLDEIRRVAHDQPN
jgi:predicted transposase YdaD